ncbi:MAG: dicarboxylate/amino acid:cation symporter [Coxiellaceae bacterium]|jgi:Na+/H+-dicarboxylate symporter|nr:dicarboxylate/amino acid:cation symporter [Coxiellaceae bacterium]
MIFDDFFRKKFQLGNKLWLYTIAIITGALCGYFNMLQPIAAFISNVFIKMFKCLSLPIIVISVTVALSQQGSNASLKKMGKQSLIYALLTTIIASSVACILYLLISPSNIANVPIGTAQDIPAGKYSDYVLNIIPSNIFSPFLENNVMEALFLGIVTGLAVKVLPDVGSKTMHDFFKIIHEMLLIIIGWVVKILPIAIFGFITTAVVQLKSSEAIKGLSSYLCVIIFANTIQASIILPIFLYLNKINPWRSFKAMMPALSIAFFSKSSAGTLPVTMNVAEKNLGISRSTSRFVLPLCTAINMNGCAAFIFTSVVYVMQNHGISIGLVTMIQWIFISTIAAIGNAGVPMGCFFLSLSLLASLNVPFDILWLILPFYSVIDMVETALNVWSDCCITKIVDKNVHLSESTPN